MTDETPRGFEDVLKEVYKYSKDKYGFGIPSDVLQKAISLTASQKNKEFAEMIDEERNYWAGRGTVGVKAIMRIKQKLAELSHQQEASAFPSKTGSEKGK